MVEVNKAKLTLKYSWLISGVLFVFLMVNDGYHHFVRGQEVSWKVAFFENILLSCVFSMFVFLVIYFSSEEPESGD